MAITNYTELQDAITDWLDRTDLTPVVETFIANAEGSLRRRPEVRNLETTTLLVDQEEVGLPFDLKQIEELYFPGPTRFGSIDIVSQSALAQEKQIAGLTGPPRKASVVRKRRLRLAPVPDQQLTLGLSYWQTVPTLTDAAPTNWLLTDHPDIYLYASLVESAPYLREDPRLAVWEQELGRRIDELNRNIEREQWGGSLVARARSGVIP